MDLQLNNIKTIILCGGIGKRIFPITTDKSLLRFNGIPLIQHQINTAKKAGLTEFIIVCNPSNHGELVSIISAIPDIKADFHVQTNSYGMADALLTCAPSIGNQPFFLVSSNDIVETYAYILLIDEYKANPDYNSYLTVRKVESYFPGGYVNVDTSRNIKAIIEKPVPGEEPSNLINIVLHLHTKPQILLDYLPKTLSRKDDIYEKTLNIMLKNKYRMKAVEYTGTWKTMKYPWHILEVMEYFLDNMEVYRSTNAQISDRATITGKVFIEDNAKILEGVVIRGPSFIGKNSIIGNNVLIRNSYIGNNCVVGYNTEIKQSYINNDCWFHSDYIGDSVIDNNCSLGAGAVTANFRLDESNIEVKMDDEKINTGHDKLGAFIGANCRIGINTSIMPGIRIGYNSIIGPHLNIEQDIEPGKRIMGTFKSIKIDNTKGIDVNKRTNLYKKVV
jgi:NDP-sugar pyrophosphorylase family protein